VTLVAAGPGRPLSAVEARHLDAWLNAGGQLILLTENGWPLRAGAGEMTSSEVAADGNRAKHETLLSRYAPGLRWSKPDKFNTGPGAGSSLPAGEVVLGWRRSFRDTDSAKVIASSGNAVLGVEIAVGKGRIVAVADPVMASNRALRRTDNAVWLVSLAASGGGQILFDEYHHGFGQKRGTLELTYAFLMTPWGWCVLQLAAAGLLFVFVFRRRFGRIKEPFSPRRASPLELVEARAGVFRAAGAQQLAAELIVQHLCAHLGKAHSRSAGAGNPERELANLAHGGAASAKALHALFVRVQNGGRLNEREFIELGRTAGEILRGPKS
jgi:hypothetical protein